jgi:hypothetical protein
MSELIYRVTRKLEQALMCHTLPKVLEMEIIFIEASPHGLRNAALGIGKIQ